MGTWARTDGAARLVRGERKTGRDAPLPLLEAQHAPSTVDPSAPTDELDAVPRTDVARARQREAALDAPDVLVAGRYRILGVLGAGGMGTVFAAEHADLGKRVALKVLAPFFEREGEAVARFLREARAASRIESDHIAQVFDVGEDVHLGLYMVMELLRGEDLARALAARGRLRPEEAAAIAGQVCLALERAHEAGVVHRDLKPANVFLARADDGSTKVKVLDFGVAKLLRDAQELEQHGSLTRAGTALGTPQYMAPEQAQGLSTIDARADVYSLGAVLFECVAGAPPYPPDEPYERTLYRVLSEPPPRLDERAPGVDRAFVDLVAEMMARDPAARPASAAAVRARLTAVFPGLRRRHLFLGEPASQAAPSAPAEPPRLSARPPPRTASAVILEAARRSTMPPAARNVMSAVLTALATMVVGSLVIALFAARGSRALPEVATVSAGTPIVIPAEGPSVVPAPQPTPQAGETAEGAVKDAERALNRGDATRARDLALDAARRAPTSAEAWITLGAAQEALGDRASARRSYEACVRQAEGPRARECRALLER